MLIKAPYISQWSDKKFTDLIINQNMDPCEDSTWVTKGFESKTEYRFWSDRVCGLACLESILQAWAIPYTTRYDLLKACLAHEVYVVKDKENVLGLNYWPFSRWVLNTFNINVTVEENQPLSSLLEKITENSFVMVSVSKEIKNPYDQNTMKGGHLVLILGVEDDEVIFHNPSGIDPYQSYARLPIAVFDRHFSGRGMTLRRKKSTERISTKEE